MSLSYGFIETQGLVGSIEAADAMLKAAEVRLIEKREIGFGLVTVIIEGELGAVQASVDAGRVAAERVGQYITSHVIANPFKDTGNLVAQSIKQKPDKPVSKKPLSAPVRAVGDKKKKIKLNQKKKSEENPLAAIIAILEKEQSGIALNQLAEKIDKTTSETRVLLKQLIDDGRIEKVQQRYFLLNN